ncbi:bifunctional phosphoribosyl-AMP cyclohydrolase/phosphoribosyl-ATP diphosphatase HisIE [Pseudoxanthomonas sp. SGNA-20]|jgi:phosphoribosyl-ATP pyrophosphohydrolase|uniref:Histidine biosynthesis bifunctional protein HisIE n=1 Tax=Pseudoxanthomonas taiwanensis J19 TaxID=935569 RepID=A0A562DL98_9GAMM|nr:MULTISPECIES: bifunctional phosphoribosyl-AMP cyclohydrolase/phosphoribosyl-ATP diphosphatase HisIE [Pseudoxanthomonas]RRN57308.1 bifunctional phosphoribosyl-AMP cyclohydrolase/phosphoribosyl-ATP diphosphatase HisIE [Pseudoxanthomonas sp. SGNA-20]TWH10327.1 phosphoribosyl-ATP pyrophosphatase /phosphoribosyl-AMP cyclohydrolase [Pseudoxanthomonas taiwanensis J19]
MSEDPGAAAVGRIGVFPEALDWDKSGGLLPVVVQDADNLRVLMLGYMDRDALQATLSRRLVTFYSRSKQRLWTKGETSGHVLELVDIQADCDADALLVLARPHGPTCHLQRPSCFEAAPHAAAVPPPRTLEPDIGFLAQLDELVARRERERPQGSYTTKLFEAGVRRIAQKVGEEGVETALAGVAQNDEQLLGEVADLVYHTTVLLHARRLSLADAVAVLEERHAQRAGG